MYSSVSEFISDWKNESALTMKIFDAVPDEKMEIIPSENIRTLARLAWHIAHTTIEMPHKAGLFDSESAGEDDVPKTVAELKAKFLKFNNELIAALETKWTNTNLGDELTIYGQTWTKGQLLSVLTKHMIHHRAQMTVIMRMLGIKVPGIYGPAKEEWSAFGMETKL